MRSLQLLRTLAFASLATFPLCPAHAIVDGLYDPGSGTFESRRFTNATIGATALYAEGFYGERTVIANVEGGHVWGGHEIFDRSAFPHLPPAPSLKVDGTEIPGDTPALGSYETHATMVGGVLVGGGYNAGSGTWDEQRMGIAPKAELWSGAMGTEFFPNGTFDLSLGSFLKPYKAFFNGVEGRKADVINSSIGFEDRAGTTDGTMIVDALSRQNRTVALVMSAGNQGAGSVNGMASGYNVLSIGSVGGERLPNGQFTPSGFSSHGPADFYNPETDQTLTGVRATVHLAAPGERLVVATYPPAGTPEPLPTDGYRHNTNGTSFSAPIVAGAVALLKDIAYSDTVPGLNTEDARDTRVIRSVLMAGTERTDGWDNGQRLVGGILSTTQSLDYRTGAGALDLVASTAIYREGTVDVAGLGGGSIATHGWDFGSVALGVDNDYLFTNPFEEAFTLTVSLNWFIDRTFDNDTNAYAERSFANLDLEVWSLSEGAFLEKIAQSHSEYNSSEFLRITLAAAGEYALRVTFAGVVFDLGETPLSSAEYGLAWRAEPVPEPGSVLLILLGVAGGIALGRSRGSILRQ